MFLYIYAQCWPLVLHKHIITAFFSSLFLVFLMDFPYIYCVLVCSQNLHISVLRSKPVNIHDFFPKSIIIECVKIRRLGLKLKVILILLLLQQLLIYLKGDEPASFIPQRQISTSLIEFESSEVIFFDKLLTVAFIAEELRASISVYRLTLFVHNFL